MKLKILIVNTCILLTVCSQTLFAYSTFASLDTLIQRAGQSIRPKDTFNELNKSIDVGNIYTSSYKLAQQEFASTVLGTVRAMAGEINGKYNCDMTLNDIGNILAPITSINNDIQGALAVIRENASPQDNASFANSCAKLMQCRGGISVKNGEKARYNLTIESGQKISDAAFQTCKTYTTEVYNAKSRILGPSVELTSTVAGNDIFYNGEENDAPYDLLIDMQRIGDVLFSDNQKTDKTLFFTFPTNSIAGFQAIGFDGDTTNSTVNTPVQIGGNAGSSYMSQNNAYQSSNLPSYPTNMGSSYNSILPIIPQTDTSSTNTNNNTIANTQTSIENYACGIQAISPLPTTSTGSSSNNQNNNASGNTDNQTNTQGGEQNPTQGTFDSNSPYYSPIVSAQDNPIVDNADWESPDDYEKQEAAIKSCVNKCSGLKAADKAMCSAKCMCGTSYTKDGLFGLSVCTIPTYQQDVAGSKTAQSIEDIISEINNIFLALKNSGEMIKHTKTTEMFDTALSKIKINKIFAFDINIGFKPVLDSKPDAKSKQESQDASDKLLKGNYGSIDIASEKNKYLTLYNPLEEEARKKGGTNVAEVQDNLKATRSKILEINKKILTDKDTATLAQSQNAEVADIVKRFLEQNIRFLTYLNETLANTQATAEQFNQKIGKGQ